MLRGLLEFQVEGEAMEPHEIERTTFTIARRGYERSEVDAFLARVAADIRKVVAAEASRRANADASSAGPAEPYGNIGSHVGTVLAAAAKAAEEMKLAAELEASQVLSEASKKAADVERESVRVAAKSREEAAHVDREIGSRKAGARDEVTRIVREAEDKGALIEAEAKERATKLERIARVNVDAILAEGRAKYKRLRQASQLCSDRLAALEMMLHDLRTEAALGSGNGSEDSDQEELSSDPAAAQAWGPARTERPRVGGAGGSTAPGSGRPDRAKHTEKEVGGILAAQGERAGRRANEAGS